MKKTVILLFIFALAFSIRAAYLSQKQSGIETDEIGYDRAATALLEGKGYVDAKGLPTSYRPPFYSAFVAFLYMLFGRSLFAVRIVQAVMGAITVCILYLTAERIFDRVTALFAGIFSAFYMSFVACAGLLYSETLFTFFLVLIIYLVVTMDRPGIAKFCVLGFLCGFLTLIRSAGVFMPFIALLFLIAKMRSNKIFTKKIIANSLAILLCFMAVILPWVVRNYKVHSRFVFISTNGGINLYQGLCRPEGGMIFTFPPGSEMSKRHDAFTDELERNDFFTREAIRIYKARPLFALKMFAVRFLFFWNIIDWEILGGDIINYHYLFILPFSLMGAFYGFKNHKKSLPILAVILYFASFTLLFPGFSRYRMPVDGYIIIFGSYGILAFLRDRRQKIYPFLCVGGYFLFTYVLYKHSLQTKYFVRALMENAGLWR